ncbi:MAG: YqgE/AlgH family protein [Paracoccaceae bacterium]
MIKKHPTLKQAEDIPFLDGRLLVALPGMGDPRFEHAVVFVCVHSPEGAMGLIINKPAVELKLSDLAEQLNLTDAENADRYLAQVHLGGPVEHGRGFVLHSPDYEGAEHTMNVSPEFGMTATLDILADIASGDGPAQALLMLGYAGWGPGQLEDELRNNAWLICESSPKLVFGTADDDKWRATLASIGIDARMLSGAGGSA